MSFQHNLMAHQVSANLLRQLRTGNADWAHERLTGRTTLWQSMSDWPRPDIAFEDRSTSASLALEFKPPNQPKREYVTGLGQAITYLNDFEFTGLVVPELADDGFKIGNYFADMLGDVLSHIPVALFTYNLTPAELNVRRPLITRQSPPSGIPVGVGKQVFWGYWRDLSNYDLLTLLNVASRLSRGGFDRVFRNYWVNFAVRGNARTWENIRRKRKEINAPSYSGEKANVSLAMRHAGLLSSEGRLTAAGYNVLQVGKVYGAESVAFLDQLARQVLIEGRHLDLIFWVEEQQRNISPGRKRTADRFYKALDRNLVREGIIAPLPANRAKQYFLRDELKLWNKLGLLVHNENNQYFYSGHGLAFNWRKIVFVLESTTA